MQMYNACLSDLHRAQLPATSSMWSDWFAWTETLLLTQVGHDSLLAAFLVGSEVDPWDFCAHKSSSSGGTSLEDWLCFCLSITVVPSNLSSIREVMKAAESLFVAQRPDAVGWWCEDDEDLYRIHPWGSEPSIIMWTWVWWIRLGRSFKLSIASA